MSEETIKDIKEALSSIPELVEESNDHEIPPTIEYILQLFSDIEEELSTLQDKLDQLKKENENRKKRRAAATKTKYGDLLELLDQLQAELKAIKDKKKIRDAELNEDCRVCKIEHKEEVAELEGEPLFEGYILKGQPEDVRNGLFCNLEIAYEMADLFIECSDVDYNDIIKVFVKENTNDDQSKGEG